MNPASDSPQRNPDKNSGGCEAPAQSEVIPPLPDDALRILIVDDEAPLRGILRIALEDEGHWIGEAADGVAGLERFCAEMWDVVLTDRTMPKMNGFELASAIKARNPCMPVVMITGTPHIPSPFVPGLPLPIDALLPKPFTIQQLRAVMKQALAKVQASKS